MSDINRLTEALVAFRDARDWKQFHKPKDLAAAISIEAAELLELFLWKDSAEADADRVRDELADVISYALLLAQHYDLSVEDIVLEKIRSNEGRYPVDKAKGRSDKYDEL